MLGRCCTSFCSRFWGAPATSLLMARPCARGGQRSQRAHTDGACLSSCTPLMSECQASAHLQQFSAFSQLFFLLSQGLRLCRAEGRGGRKRPKSCLDISDVTCSRTASNAYCLIARHCASVAHFDLVEIFDRCEKKGVIESPSLHKR